MIRPDYDPILPEQPADDAFPPEDLPPRRKSKRWIIILLIVCFMIFMFGYILYSSMLEYTGYSRLKAQLSDARTVYEIAQLWQEEGNPPLQSHIRQLGEEALEGSFGDFLRQYTISEHDGWYAIECDADGNALCVWYSQSEITKDELWQIPWEDSLADLKSPFRTKQAVVCYPQEGGTPIDEPVD